MHPNRVASSKPLRALRRSSIVLADMRSGPGCRLSQKGAATARSVTQSAVILLRHLRHAPGAFGGACRKVPARPPLRAAALLLPLPADTARSSHADPGPLLLPPRVGLHCRSLAHGALAMAPLSRIAVHPGTGRNAPGGPGPWRTRLGRTQHDRAVRAHARFGGVHQHGKPGKGFLDTQRLHGAARDSSGTKPATSSPTST